MNFMQVFLMSKHMPKCILTSVKNLTLTTGIKQKEFLKTFKVSCAEAILGPVKVIFTILAIQNG